MIFDDRFYSAAELAKVTGYHRDSIYRAIASGKLVAAKPGAKWLIAGSAINEWLLSGKEASIPALTQAASAGRRSENVVRPRTLGSRPSFRELARRQRAA